MGSPGRSPPPERLAPEEGVPVSTATCPCCGSKESVPETSAGKRVLCSNCGTPFVAGAAPPPPPEEPAPAAAEPVEDAPIDGVALEPVAATRGGAAPDRDEDK